MSRRDFFRAIAAGSAAVLGLIPLCGRREIRPIRKLELRSVAVHPRAAAVDPRGAVICDETTNSPETIARNEVHAVIHVPQEQVVFDLLETPTGERVSRARWVR